MMVIATENYARNTVKRKVLREHVSLSMIKVARLLQ